MRKIFLLVPFLFLFSFLLNAQDKTESSRPKIGLVLSGGGAKGISHIGVLKALEKAGIRPDYIAGTSMGSIVGGLYAIGYSADTLEKMVRGIDWDQVLSNKIPLNYIAYEEKFYYNRYLINFPIVDWKLTLPNGLIEGQMLSEMLSDFAWPASKYENFDEFPIPFRCVATDVSNGQPYIFKDGPLSKAMRASMSIPTAFTSQVMDSTLLVDGGIINNFPVEILKEMGADIIIGVNVSSAGFDKASEINNIPGILMQMAMINALERLPGQIEQCDIYVAPKLKGYSSGSFGSYEEILQIGDEAGEEAFPEFKELADRLNLLDTTYKGISIKVDPIIIGQLLLNGNTLTPNYVVKGKLGIEEGDLVERDEIEMGVRSVFGLNNFRKVEYHLDRIEGTNEYRLLIDMLEKSPVSLLASVHYDNTFSAGVVLNLTLKNILLKGSRTAVVFDISENPRIRFDYLKYMGKYQNFALNAIYDYHALEIPTYEKGEIKDYANSNYHNLRLLAITTHSLKHRFSFGYEFTTYLEKSKFSFNLPEGINKTRIQYHQIVAGFSRNSLNDRNFPSKGSSTEIILKTYLSNNYSATFKTGVDSVTILGIQFDETMTNELLRELEPDYFVQLYVVNNTFIQFSKKFQMIPKLALGLLISDEPVFDIYNEFRLGGFQQVNINDTRLYGLNFGELYAPNFGAIGLSLQNILWKNLFIQYGFNALAYYDYVPISNLSSIDWDDLFNNNTMIGYGLALRYKSIIGPISFGISRNTSDSYYRFYFQLGYSLNYTD